MNDEDLRDCFAMFALLGIVSKSPIDEVDVAEERDEYGKAARGAYDYADAMMVARRPKETEGGIAAVVKQWDEPFVEDKPKRTYTRRSK